MGSLTFGGGVAFEDNFLYQPLKRVLLDFINSEVILFPKNLMQRFNGVFGECLYYLNIFAQSFIQSIGGKTRDSEALISCTINILYVTFSLQN